MKGREERREEGRWVMEKKKKYKGTEERGKVRQE